MRKKTFDSNVAKRIRIRIINRFEKIKFFFTLQMMDGPGLCNPTDNTVISSPRLDRQITENGGPDSFLLQVKKYEYAYD